ncbi:MAG: methyltransferase domain-containing protein [Chthoniobacterales bacterium]
MSRRFDPAVPELMDRPQPVSRELEIDLHNLQQLNRWFGSHALVRHFLRRWIKRGDRLRILDLATGSGDIPRLITRHARENGAQIRITALDQQAATLEIARRLSANYPEIEFVQANVLTFHAPEPFDAVLCSLALHHFGDDDAVRLLRRMRELSHRFVLVADLRRGLLATVGVYLLTAIIFREPMTKVDGRLSAQRAFSFREMRELVERAGWRNFGHRRFRFARQAIWLE